ncbi:MAG: hypothetical protein WCJ69_15815 [Betaproteobacteria bacterium]|jgi:hypothetical protein
MTPGRGRLLAVWVILAVLVGVILAVELPSWLGRGNDDQETEAAARMWLPAPIAGLAAVEIVQGGTLHRFEKDASGTWFYHGLHGSGDTGHAHQPDPEASQRILKALAGTERARLEREIVPGAGGVAEYGVAAPKMLVLFHEAGAGRPVTQYAVGDVATDGISRYVLRVGSSTVSTLPDYQIQNLVKLVESFPAGSSPLPAR